MAPRDEGELRSAIGAAGSGGKTLRVVGAGHSFNNLFDADVLVSLENMDELVSVDEAQHQITCAGGMRLGSFYQHLEHAQLSLSTFPTGFDSTLAGVVSTPTHGAGLGNPILAERMVACDILTAEGEVKTVTDRSPDMHAVRSGLGMLGVLLTVTFQCEPAFTFRRRTFVEPPDEVFEKYTERDAENLGQHLFWLPGCEQMLVLLIDRFDGQPDLDFTDSNDPAFEKAMHEWIPLALRSPHRTSVIHGQLARFFGAGEVVVRAPRGFLNYPTKRLINAEWAVPYDQLSEVFGDVRARLKKGQAFPGLLEFRSVAAGDSHLSFAYKRPSVAVGNTIFGDFDQPHPALRTFSQMMESHDARPHWAKACTVSRDWSSLFPAMADFEATRRRWDAKGVFARR